MQNFKNYNLKPIDQKQMSKKLGLNPSKIKVFIKLRHINIVRKKIKEKVKQTQDLSAFIKFNTNLKNYRYFRNLNGYPWRGQRTHTNAKTKKKYKLKNLF